MSAPCGGDREKRWREAYEAKVEDFAAETRRSSRMVGECLALIARLDGGRAPRGPRHEGLQAGMRQVAEEMLRLYQLPDHRPSSDAPQLKDEKR